MSDTRFKYSAIDSGGTKHDGEILAPSQAEAFRRLGSKGLTPLKLVADRADSSMFAFSSNTIKPDHITELTRELAVLVEAKIPLARGLASIAESESNAALKEMLNDVAVAIESGSPLTEALSRHRQHFGDVYIETLRAAERSGDLVSVMKLLADLLEKTRETKQLIKRAMAYPTIVLIAVAVAVTVIVVFVIPKFGATFASQGVEMPITTRVLQAVGENVKLYWWAYVSGLAAAIIGLICSWRTEGGRNVIEGLLLKTPYISRILTAVTASRFVRVMSIGLSSGLDVIESIEISGKASGRPLFASECRVMADRLRGGETVDGVIRSSKYLPNFSKRILSAGKDSAEMSRSCRIIADHYEREANHLTKNINTIIEPILTFALAGIVLLIALSVFLPMWKMASIKK